jgi:DNA replication protein DnaC
LALTRPAPATSRPGARTLIEARDEITLSRLRRWYLRAAVPIVDELGSVLFERAGGELLFNLVADRYERRSRIVTTDLAFSGNDNSKWPHRDDEFWPHHPAVVISSRRHLPS